MRSQPFRRRPAPPTWLLACLLATALVAGCAPGGEPFARLAGLVFDRELPEISGLAASRRHDDVFWAINDGGNAAAVYALGRSGRRLARYDIEGVPNTDWEDLATFELDGRRYLLVADTGDNGGLRHTVQLHAIPEPDTLEDGTLRPAWSVNFRWPGDAMDCEAVAVDDERGEVLLVSKRRHPAELYAVPLRPPEGELQVARKLGTLSGIPQPSRRDLEKKHSRQRLRGLVTAADLSPDGRTLAVMTYAHLLLYRRPDRDADWAAAATRPALLYDLPWIPLAEAAAWTPRGRGLVATGEFLPAPLFFLVPAPVPEPAKDE